jgi:VCBS repeat-containing protein
MSFNDTTATTTINIGALIDTTATSTENVRSLLAGSVAWSYSTVEWFADATWTPAQITQLNTIFNTWGTVTGITFQQTTVQNDAEVILIRDNNTNGFGGYSGIPADVPTTANQTFTDGSVVVSQTGQINIHIAPGGFIGSGTTNINIFDASGNITRGGFELILHEIGHSLGLKHPHNASTGNPLLWPGVTTASDLGTNSLNQDLYTLMSYNFQVVPDGSGGNTLYTMATPMAYDVAAIQLLYGANTTFNSGDTTYDLATPAAALQWTSIWDTGGTDEIIYLGANAATIDLRAATLDGTVGSGGYLSYFTFADGRTSAGFTIAGDIRNVLGDVGTEHGVIIENARTGSGNDTITGNAADNTFTGGGGDDTENGGGGNDTAVFSGSRLDHLATLLGSGAITIADQRAGMDGTDTLSNIESFRFDDGTFNQIEVLNRAPVIAADAGPHVGAEQPGVTNLPPTVTDIVSGSLSFTDANTGDTHTASSSFSSATWSGGAVIPFATMTAFANAMTASITVDGTAGTLGWSFAIADQLLDFLAVTETLSVVYNLSVADHHVGSSVSDSDTEAVTIVLNGANDVPIAVSDSNGTAKNSILTVPAVGGVLANDTDPDINDNGHLGVSAVNGSAASVGHSVAGTYGSLTLNADGSYVYAAYKGSLPAKIVAQDTFQYTVSDTHGGTETANLYIVVSNPGTNYIAGTYTTLNGNNGPDVVDGFAGHDVLLGGNGPDVLIGGDGDTLTGGNGPDTFLFRAGFGINTVTDFDTHNDKFQFDKTIFASATDILANHTTDTAAGAVISDGLGDSVTLLGVHQAQLTTDMFMLA